MSTEQSFKEKKNIYDKIIYKEKVASKKKTNRERSRNVLCHVLFERFIKQIVYNIVFDWDDKSKTID